MKHLIRHLKTYILRGFWALIPLALSLFALRLLYVSIDQRIMALVQTKLGFALPGLGILLLLMSLYLMGLITSNFLGHRLLSWMDRISSRIPVVGTTYRVGRQLATTFTLPERQVFKKVVLVDYLTPGMWTVGFVTGSVRDRRRNGETLLKVYIPTPPNPTSGTLVLVPPSQTRDPGWSVEEALQAVISAGIIGPSYVE